MPVQAVQNFEQGTVAAGRDDTVVGVQGGDPHLLYRVARTRGLPDIDVGKLLKRRSDPRQQRGRTPKGCMWIEHQQKSQASNSSFSPRQRLPSRLTGAS
jgi:hypothetical protein